MMKLVYRTFLLLCVTSVWFTLSSYEGGAAAKNKSLTGAPFGTGTCGNCHSGGSFGTVTVAIQIFEVGTSTVVTAYTAGKAYDAKLTINATTAPPLYGFQMVAVNAANTQAGAWSGFPTNVNAKTVAARIYVEQKLALTANVNSMTWVAPIAGTGTVKFYACGNAVDGTGDEANDNIGITNLALPEAAPVCTSATITTASTNALCASSPTGSATVTPTGGTLPYTYLWSNGAITQTVSNLLAGNYTVTVTEGGGCTTPSSVITVGANIFSTSITASGPTALCGGNSVNLTASGGTSYTWSTGANTATLSGVTAAATYSVTATNSTCSATASKIVTHLGKIGLWVGIQKN
jgi:SprB repeat